MQQKTDYGHGTSKKKKKLAKIKSFLQKLLKKGDSTIVNGDLDIQEALKRPMKQKRKLKIFISNTFYPTKEPQDDGPDGPGQEGSVASWELQWKGRGLPVTKMILTKVKRKFSHPS
ncbi:hypothetical protein NQ317_000797 [Molorchus minor]|uniref:Uncharacterized protein n=1 Tax=Molorchus minor TaxID=1323400 RepID=A0ABQ9ISA9_9CUCU|nr:hypothetical protein NQ317_000797 [Molorchus minor]